MLLEDAFRAILRDEVRTALREELRTMLQQLPAGTDSSPVEFLSVKEAAALAGVSPATVRGWLQQGHLKRFGNGRILRVRRADLLQLLSSPTQSEPMPRSIDEQAAAIVMRRRSS